MAGHADSEAFKRSVEIFVQALRDGHLARDAYRLSHPNFKSTNNQAGDTRAYEFKKHPAVQARLEELRRESRERHHEFADKLIDMLQQEVSTCFADNGTLSPVMKQTELLAKVLGIDKQTIELNAKVKKTDPETIAEKINFLAEKAKGAK